MNTSSRASGSQRKVENGTYSSYKWITTEIVDSHRVLVVNERDVTPMLRNLHSQPCNLISVFGRARQGKSFLMNCLAGEREIFRISNEKESCTQGIDISDKWIGIEEFSSLDGGRGVTGSTLIGFIDAEGQGDKNVTYDATLICPILLVSKCVVFNWKGDLQKDHLLESLGIMTRAASNVASESSSSRGSSSTSSTTAAKFSHLHIVFRDWQAVGSSPASVFSALFDQENVAESATRDRIRREVLASFASVRVWLFEAPTESAKALKQKLNIEMTTPAFRNQLREFRAALSLQLKEVTTIAGQVLTGKNLGPIMNEFAKALNSGQAVMPHSAFVNMIAAELNQVKQSFEKRITDASNAWLARLSKKDSNGYLVVSQKDVEDSFKAEVESIISIFDIESRSIVGEGMTGDVQIIENVHAENVKSLRRHAEQLASHLQASYQIELSNWLRLRRREAELDIERKINSLLSPDQVLGSARLQTLLDEIEDQYKTFIGATRYHSSPEMTDTLNQLKRYFDQLAQNAKNEHKARISRIIPQLIETECRKLLTSIPATIDKLAAMSPSGVESHKLEEQLNAQYNVALDLILAKAASLGVDTEQVESEFETACVDMNKELKRCYSAAISRAMDDAVKDGIAFAKSQVNTHFGPYLSNTRPWEDSTAAALSFEDKLSSIDSSTRDRVIDRVRKWSLPAGSTTLQDSLNELSVVTQDVRSARAKGIEAQRREAARLEAIEAERRELEARRRQQEEMERQQQIERERKEAEELRRRQAEIENRERERQAQLESERRLREERERIAQVERERHAQLERERLLQEERARVEKERAAAAAELERQAARDREAQKRALEEEQEDSFENGSNPTPLKKKKGAGASAAEQLANAGKWFEANHRQAAPSPSSSSAGAGQSPSPAPKAADPVAAAIEAQRRAEEERRQQAVKDAANWDKKKRGKK